MSDHPSLSDYPCYPDSSIGYKFKRFIVFYCEQYYPSGALSDAVATFDTLQEASDYLRETKRANSIFDCDERCEVEPLPRSSA